jgi:hypothetical protein
VPGKLLLAAASIVAVLTLAGCPGVKVEPEQIEVKEKKPGVGEVLMHGRENDAAMFEITQRLAGAHKADFEIVKSCTGGYEVEADHTTECTFEVGWAPGVPFTPGFTAIVETEWKLNSEAAKTITTTVEAVV